MMPLCCTISDNAVITATINDDAVTQAKIADDAVGADQLANTAVSAGSYTLLQSQLMLKEELQLLHQEQLVAETLFSNN